MRSRRAAGLAALFAAAASIAALDRQPMTYEDILGLRRVAGAAISPDGRAVLFTVRQFEGKDRDPRWHIWIASLPDRPRRAERDAARFGIEGVPAVRQLTFGSRGESQPLWSPDGATVAFLAARDERLRTRGEQAAPTPQVWMVPARGGEPRRVTGAKEGVTGYAWSPDSRRIAFTARDPAPREAEERRTRKDDAHVFEEDFQMTHLWVARSDGAEPAQITGGRRFTVSGDPAWSPDGERIAIATASTPLARDQFSRTDIRVVTVATKTDEVVSVNAGPDDAPAWSPDGAWIAYRSTPEPAGLVRVPRTAHVLVYNVASRQTRDLGDAQDAGIGPPVWLPDSRRILFTAQRGVHREIVSVDLEGRYTTLTRNFEVDAFQLDRTGSRVAFTLESPSDPPDVYVSDLTFRTPRRLTDMNPFVRLRALGESETVRWRSPDGLAIEGVLLKPVNYHSGRRYPMVVNCHGGPTGAWTDGFHGGWSDDGQRWAGAGWAVFYPNPRGSTGYGQDFLRASASDWGGGDARDVIAGVDAMIARGIADPDRLAIMGWSYGGYLATWIITLTPRFKAAMIGAGISDLASMYGTTDIQDYLGGFFNGPFGAATRGLYWERSGLTYADRVTTPTLLLHGERDERVPIGQPLEFYRALKDNGRRVQLVWYPREPHGFQEYWHQLDKMKRTFEWVSQHTLKAGTETTSK